MPRPRPSPGSGPCTPLGGQGGGWDHMQAHLHGSVFAGWYKPCGRTPPQPPTYGNQQPQGCMQIEAGTNMQVGLAHHMWMQVARPLRLGCPCPTASFSVPRTHSMNRAAGRASPSGQAELLPQPPGRLAPPSGIPASAWCSGRPQSLTAAAMARLALPARIRRQPTYVKAFEEHAWARATLTS